MPRDGHDIRYLFEPRSVAVVGASHDSRKIGYKILQNIVEGGYEGRILPVNPRGGEILGLPVFTSLEEAGGEMDLVITTVPARFATAAVRDAADLGTKFNLVIT
ncbi:CoA-binding protein, partial [bacterium]|nr:CoA-binding protein [bacterium]